MNRLHRVVAVGAVLTVGWCGLARGQQVLEQVPADAAGVFEVKDLQGLSTKIAKFAKSLGIDQFQPAFADPLGALQDEFDLKQGLNKNGDMAIAFFVPPDKKGEGKAEGNDAPPPAIVLVPVSDYKAFLGNFKEVKDAGNQISEVTVPKNGEKLYVVEHGQYAEAAMDKALLSKPAGLKLAGPAAKEAQSRDAILYFDMKTLRPTLEKGMQQARKEMDKAAKDPNAAKGNPFGAQFSNPQMAKLLEAYMNAGEQIIKDSRSATISFNISDLGISSAAVADFEPDSDLGKMVAQVKNTDQPLMGGLPEATYFGFGGARLTPQVTTKLMDDIMVPMLKGFQTDANAADMTRAIDAMKDMAANMKSMSMGYVATNGGPGDGVVGVVGVIHGDANKILADQKAVLPAMNAFMGVGGQKSTVDVQFGEPTTVSGVKLENYTVKFNFDPNEPQAAQAQQMMSMMYGRGGLKGSLGVLNPDTLISVQAGNEKLVADAIAAAKADDNHLDQMAGVKKVAAELPKQRAAEFYIAIDNIATAAVKAAKQQGLAVQFKLPPNLPPIGVSMGTDGSTARVEGIIPSQLIQSITAAVMQAMMQQNGGPGGAGGI
ncbi:MAG TPA: hypothetical protein VLJ39_17490 [Tepidisphaeraceae bacterium]|nr:hypothetical protein [Tepidisphaeraceae bacterium]